MTQHIVIEIIHADTGAVVVCDTLAHIIASDDGIAAEADDILAALARGEFYSIGGGAADGFVIQPAPQAAWSFFE